MKRLLLAATALLALSGAANAVTVLTTANIGQTGTGTFNGNNSGTPISDIHASLELTLSNVNTTTNTWYFSYELINTTASPWTASLPSFGFDTNPTLNYPNSGVGAGSFFDLKSSGSISGGVQLDFCATAGANCAGGQANGLVPGETGTGTFYLDFEGTANALTTITLSNWTVRYQQIACLDVAICGNVNDGSGIGTSDGPVLNPLTPAVPEASTWAMMILGFLGVGVMGMRQRRKFRIA